MSKFTQEVSMSCSEATNDQIRDLVEKLLKIEGYGWISENFSLEDNIKRGQNLLTNSYQCRGIGFRSDLGIVEKTHLEEFNPELYLALACMTDGDMPIIGEWLKIDNETHSCNGELFEVKLFGKCNNSKTGKLIRGEKLDRIYRKASKQEIMNHFKKEKGMKTGKSRFPFTLKKSEVKTIMEAACLGWKDKLADKWGAELLRRGIVTVDQEFYKVIREVCDDSQNKVMDTVFGTDVEFIPEGTACFVSDDNSYTLRYANGRGMFYAGGEKEAATLYSWKNVHILKDQTDVPEIK